MLLQDLLWMTIVGLRFDLCSCLRSSDAPAMHSRMLLSLFFPFKICYLTAVVSKASAKESGYAFKVWLLFRPTSYFSPAVPMWTLPPPFSMQSYMNIRSSFLFLFRPALTPDSVLAFFLCLQFSNTAAFLHWIFVNLFLSSLLVLFCLRSPFFTAYCPARSLYIPASRNSSQSNFTFQHCFILTRHIIIMGPISSLSSRSDETNVLIL